MSELDFNIGAEVLCEDGSCGRLLKVVVDPDSREVTDLIVEQGLLLSEDRILPVEAVKETTEQEIRLSISSDQLDCFEQYDEEAVEVPAPGWEGLGTYKEGQAVRWVAEGAPYGIVFAKEMVPSVRRRLQKGVSADRAVVERGTVVKTVQGKLGSVDHVLADAETGGIAHVVVRRGPLARSVVLPVEKVRELSDEVLFVDLTEEQLNELPRYRPPGEATILKRLQDRLEEATPDFGGVEVVFDGGILKLSGVVPDIASKREAEASARSLDGVVDVANDLQTDTAIASRVRAAVADEPRTELADVGVVSNGGVVTLTGKVDDAETREAVEQVAEEQRGVIEVINDLSVAKDEFTSRLQGDRVEGPAMNDRSAALPTKFQLFPTKANASSHQAHPQRAAVCGSMDPRTRGWSVV